MAENYVIIGNGIAGVTAAEVLRNEDSTAEVSIISDDPFPPYYRPALKDYLAGRVHADKLWSRPVGFYQERQIRLIMAQAVAIWSGRHLVQLEDRQEVGYSRLLLACGARPSRLNCPGTNLVGVTTLRSVADYQEMQVRLIQTRRIVVIGSGALALETVETLRRRGYEVSHLLRRRTLWSEVLDATASDLILQQERRDGVDVHVEEEVKEILGKDGQVAGVVTSSGAQIAGEIVIMAIGIEPNLDLPKKSGIPCGRGMIVDQTMRTSASDIYAAGDMLEMVDNMTGRTRILGQWYPAIQQAKMAAYNMLGHLDTSQPAPGTLFYNATNLYGLEMAAAGLSQAFQHNQSYQEIIADPEPRVYRKVILKDGVAVGMLMLGNRRGALACKRAIAHGVNLQPVNRRLFDNDFDLDAWLDQQGVPPVRLNVSRAGTAAIRPATLTSAKREATLTNTTVVPATLINTSIAKERNMTSALSEKAWLIPVTGMPSSTAATTKLRLSQTKVMSVGRQEGMYLLIDHASVSRRHAEISCENGQYLLCDVGSSNGTFVNNARLETQRVYPLKSRDQVRFGQVIYQFYMEAAKRAEMPKSTETRASNPLVHEMPTGFYNPTASSVPIASYQPVLNAKGELLLPGADRAISAEILATFSAGPVLVAIQRGIPTVLPLQQSKCFTLGRDKTNDLILTDIAISRKHAEIIPRIDGFYIRDLDSSNGVLVNRIKIDNPYRLAHGDRIQIGDIIIYFLHQVPTMPALPAFSDDPKMICSICGAVHASTSRSCINCGTSLEEPAATSTQRRSIHVGK